MRHESAVTSISWIPSEAMTGPMRLPMDLHIGHYDDAPPDHLEPGDLETLREQDRFRFANHLSAWVEAEDGEIVDAGYSGGGLVGSTTAKLGLSVTIPGVAFPIIQASPLIEGGKATFRQTAGGRTGAPLPHRIDHPPYVRMTGPTAWTSLELTITSSGASFFELTGASPFPRHWIYGADGDLAAKSGTIDFEDWTHHQESEGTPWDDHEHAVLLSGVESQVERELSNVIMGDKPELVPFAESDVIIEQGQPGGPIYLILDGLAHVDVDGEGVAELGPGAIIGERSVLEGGLATATVTATTAVRTAKVPAADLATDALEEIASTHRSEDG